MSKKVKYIGLELTEEELGRCGYPVSNRCTQEKNNLS